jgi:hypothetical protein
VEEMIYESHQPHTDPTISDLRAIIKDLEEKIEVLKSAKP